MCGRSRSRIRIRILAMAVGSLLACAGPSGGEAQVRSSVEPPAGVDTGTGESLAAAMLRAVASGYAELGFDIDLDGLRLEQVAEADWAERSVLAEADDGRTLAAISEFSTALLFGIPAQGAGAQGAGAQAGAADQLLAVYRPAEQVVAIRTQTSQDPQLLRTTLAHELAHRWQHSAGWLDIETSVAPELGADRSVVRRMLMEGHAMVMSGFFELGLHRQAFAQLPLATAWPSASSAVLELDPVTASYRVGTRCVARQLAAQGWSGLEALMRGPTPSSEYCLKPLDYPRDEPRVLPEFNGRDLAELAGLAASSDLDVGSSSFGPWWIATWLRHLNGSSSATAWLTASGWDADRLIWLRHATGELLVWYSWWDRPEDALQMTRAIRAVSRAPGRSSIAVRGRAVLMAVFVDRKAGVVSALSRELATTLLDRLEPVAGSPGQGPQDASGTKAHESAEQRATGRLLWDAGAHLWAPDHGLRLPLAETEVVERAREYRRRARADDAAVELSPMAAAMDAIRSRAERPCTHGGPRIDPSQVENAETGTRLLGMICDPTQPKRPALWLFDAPAAANRGESAASDDPRFVVSGRSTRYDHAPAPGREGPQGDSDRRQMGVVTIEGDGRRFMISVVDASSKWAATQRRLSRFVAGVRSGD